MNCIKAQAGALSNSLGGKKKRFEDITLEVGWSSWTGIADLDHHTRVVTMMMSLISKLVKISTFRTGAWSMNVCSLIARTKSEMRNVRFVEFSVDG